MKMTLLQMVQSIMSDMESDAVTSITDTPESEQVASTARDVYFQMITNKIIPEHYSLHQLTTASTSAKVFMKIPDTVARVETIKYDKILTGETRLNYGDVCYMDPDVFLDRALANDTTDTDVTTAQDPTSGLTIHVRSDAAPSYWTSFDDEYIVFNSFDSSVDANGLVGTKTLCRGKIIPTWTMADAFVPDIDENLFPLLLAEIKSTCFVNLKQTANPKIEKQARQQKVSIQNAKFRTKKSQEAYSYSSSHIKGRGRP